jgi:acyl-CoA thioesterase
MPDAETTAFADLINRAENPGQKTSVRVPEDWMQGRTVYGGLASAMALAAMRGKVAGDRKIRSLLISFVSPLTAAPFGIETRELRSGKSVTTVESRIIQNGGVCLAAVGSFGGDRDSEIQMVPVKRPGMVSPSQALELPYIEGMTPEFTRHFHYRWAIGELPFSGKGGEQIGGWINFRQATDCLTEEWLIALADAWPTPVLSRLNSPAAASTSTWALGFVHLDRSACSENQWWAYHCEVDSAENGYVHERSRLWDPQGRLALYSQQTTTVFA